MTNKTNHHLVAVYGTLKRAYSRNPSLTTNGAEYVGDCDVTGLLLHLNAYPALVLDCGKFDREVPVEVYRVNDHCLDTLDMIEGHPNFYKRVQVQTKFGMAWVYTHDKKDHVGVQRRVITQGGWEGTTTPFMLMTFKHAEFTSNSPTLDTTVLPPQEEAPSLFPKVVNV